MFAPPKCRFCGAEWRPPQGVVAMMSFCASCRKERREIAKKELSLKRITSRDLEGKFLLPRSLRKNRKRRKRA
jgi:hypothetical protein